MLKKIISSIEKDHLRTFKCLVKSYGGNLDIVVRCVVVHGRVDMMQYLLLHTHANPGCFNNYAIQFASSYGMERMVGTLCSDFRVDPSVNNNASYRAAVKGEYIGVCRILLRDTRVQESLRIKDLSTIPYELVSYVPLQKMIRSSFFRV